MGRGCREPHPLVAEPREIDNRGVPGYDRQVWASTAWDVGGRQGRPSQTRRMRSPWRSSGRLNMP